MTDAYSAPDCEHCGRTGHYSDACPTWQPAASGEDLPDNPWKNAAMLPADVVHDAVGRMRTAEAQLTAAADSQSHKPERIRLRGKAEGVRLAMGYVEEIWR